MNLLTFADWAVRAAAALAAALAGVTMLERGRDPAGKLMGWAALILFLGTAADLLARVLGAGAMGRAAGRAAWHIALTVFVVLLSLLWEKLYDKKNGYYAEMLIRDVSGIRALACVALPIVLLSGVIGGEDMDIYAGLPWYFRLIAPGVRSVMLLVAAGVVARQWSKTKAEIPALRSVRLWLLGGAALECAADLGEPFVPALGALELPALVCLAALLLCLTRHSAERAVNIE